jgi:hypothetical protein
MKHRRLIPAALACAAVLALAGCGSADEPTAVDEAGSPGAATTTPGDTPTSNGGAGTADSTGTLPPPMWPATGCDSRSVVSIDYGRMPSGYATPQEAVAHSQPGEVPDGDLQVAPAQAKGPGVVLVVDPDSNEILAQVTVFKGPDGWYVDGVTTCG